MTTTPPPRGPRPLGVAVIAIFLLLDGSLAVIDILIGTTWGTRRALMADVATWAPSVVLVFAALQLLAAIGLWRGSRLAWVVSMLVVGAGLVTALVLWWRGQPFYASMAIEVVIAFYLNQGVVREYFMGPARGRPVAPGRKDVGRDDRLDKADRS